MTMMQKPAIRFEGFSENWVAQRLGDVISRISTGLNPRDNFTLNSGGTNYYVTIKNFENGILHLDESCDLVDDAALALIQKRSDLKKGDILFTSIGRIGDCYLIESTPENWNINESVFSLRPDGNCVDPKYLIHSIHSDAILCQILGTITGSTFQSIKIGSLKNTVLPVPSLPEQQAIGALFAQLDRLIGLQQEKCRKLRHVKQACLEKMFPQDGRDVPEIRFRGFTGAWEQRKLGDVCEKVIRKNSDGKCNLPLTISGQYGLVDQITYFNKQIASQDVSNYYLVFNGEFAYNKSTSDGFPFGAIKRLNDYEKGVLSTLYIVFRIEDITSVDSDFLVSFFDTGHWHNDVRDRAAEGARNHGLLNISADDFFDINICLPSSFSEQQAIGAFFKHLDTQISLHQQKLDKLQDVKKALLEKMMGVQE